MTEFVESLKRLYQDKKVLKMEQLNKLRWKNLEAGF